MNALAVLGLLCGHLVLMSLPLAAGYLLAARAGIRRVPLLIGVGLVASGVVAYATLWAFYASHPIGLAVTWLGYAGSITAIGIALRGGVDRAHLHDLAMALGLWGLGSLFVALLGFLHGGESSPILMAATRYAGELPSDSEIPRFFAEWYYDHSHAYPPVFPGGWLASDRPPLQIGYVLTQRPIMWDAHELNYELTGVLCQQLWIVGLWAMVRAVPMSALTRGLILVAVLVSDSVIVNGFFVWPKLLAAAMLLPAAAIILSPLWSEVRRTRAGPTLVIALFALSLLSHGGGIFGVVPLALIAIARGLPSIRWVVVGLVAGAVLWAPWAAYQKYAVPPGNHLTKWMLAGAVPIDHNSVGHDIIRDYRRAGLNGAVHNKLENLATEVGGGPMVDGLVDTGNAVGSGRLATALDDLRPILFFNLFPAFGLLLIAPLWTFVRRRRGLRRRELWDYALLAYVFLVGGAVLWAILLFGNFPSRAVIHQGTYAFPVIGIFAMVLGLRVVAPRVAIWVVAASVISMLVVYVPVLEPMSSTGYSPVAAVLSAAALLGFASLSGIRRATPWPHPRLPRLIAGARTPSGA